jgi:hypothetical protein
MIQFGLAANILFPWQIAQGNNNRTAAALAGPPPTDGHFYQKVLVPGRFPVISWTVAQRRRWCSCVRWHTVRRGRNLLGGTWTEALSR